MKNYVLCVLMGFLTIFGLLGVDVKDDISPYKLGTSKDVIFRFNEHIESYIKRTYYSSYDIESIELVENDNFLIDNCPYYNQSTFNRYYNENKAEQDKKISGTCAVIAAVSTVAFYNMYDNNNYINETYNNLSTEYLRQKEFFCDLMDKAIEKKYTTRSNGTDSDKLNNLLTLAYDMTGSNRYGNTEWYHIKKKLNKSLLNKLPEMYSLKDHVVVVCGYTSYTYTIHYRKNNKLKSITGTKEAYIVNEGWGEQRRSIVFKDKVGNITNGHLVVISSKK